MLDFAAFKAGRQTLAELTAQLTPLDLHHLTDAMLDAMAAIIRDARNVDVTFVPQDPLAHDTFGSSDEAEMAWTLGHVVVHATASAEEAAALSSVLARGIVPDYRLRYETPWQAVTTATQLRQRLEESRRMRHGFLMTWPDEPLLATTYAPVPAWGPLNAVSRFVLGLAHDADHLEQLAEIMRQARIARPAAVHF